MNDLMHVVRRPKFIDYLAPDSSEIRLLKSGFNGGLCECTLGPGAITKAVSHKVVEENWYVLNGKGQLWRRLSGDPTIVDLSPGDSVTIPLGTEFQFKAGRSAPLVMLLATMPVWQEEVDAAGPDPSEGHWTPRLPPLEFTIQGNWWQLSRSGEGENRLAHMRLVRVGEGRFEIEGKSFTDGWTPRADFGASEARFSAEDRVLRYDWAGRRGDDVFAGSGQILFMPTDPVNLATGYYDISLGIDVKSSSRVNVYYSRLGEGENLDQLRTDGAKFDSVVKGHFADAAPPEAAATA